MRPHLYSSALWVVCISVFVCTRAPAQDARFSQFSTTPLLTNPALTGVMNGQLRFTANFKEIYSTVAGPEAYKSVAAAAEIRRPVGNGNFAGVGLMLQHDRAGTSDFIRSQGALSASYQQQLTGGRGRRGAAHFISGGAQVGFGQRGFDLTKLWFSEQYFVNNATREAYLDRGLSNGEPYGGAGSTVYLDVNAGLAWFASFGERSGAYLGGAIYHLTKPNISPIVESPDQLDPRYTLQAGGEMPLGDGDMSLLPSALFMLQGPSTTAQIGGSVRYTERAWREVALRLGSWLRLANRREGNIGAAGAVIAVALETERVQLGLSYDVTAGEINPLTSRRGGFEISLQYLQPANYRQRVACPKF